MRRGFSLLELAAVLTIISLLVSLALPAYSHLVFRAREAEAFVQLETIAYLQEVRVLEMGAPIPCPKNPSVMPGRSPGRFEAHPAWADIGLIVTGPVFFQYQVELDGDDHFVVRAAGDPDGDGLITKFSLHSKNMDLIREVPWPSP